MSVENPAHNFDSFQNSFHQEVDTEGMEAKDTLFKTYMMMQINLAQHFFGFEPDDDQFFEWQEKHAHKFGQVLTSHPQLAQEFLHGDTEKALHDASELLYEKQGVHE
jgi:hypothetical protein